MTKYRLIVEYENDDPASTLQYENQAWIDGDVAVVDCIGAGDCFFRLEVVKPLHEAAVGFVQRATQPSQPLSEGDKEALFARLLPRRGGDV